MTEAATSRGAEFLIDAQELASLGTQDFVIDTYGCRRCRLFVIATGEYTLSARAGFNDADIVSGGTGVAVLTVTDHALCANWNVHDIDCGGMPKVGLRLTNSDVSAKDYSIKSVVYNP